MVFSGMFTTVVTTTVAASAEDTELDLARPVSRTSNAAPRADWHALGYVGGYGALGDGEGGVTLGGSFRYRSGLLVLGPALEMGGLLYEFVGAAAVGGLSVRSRDNVRFELLGAFGGHYYAEVGRPLCCSDDPGASGGLAYAGGRATLGYAAGEQKGHFEFGAYADFQDDLERRRVIYTYPGDSSFAGPGIGDHVIGMARLGFGVEFGGTHDIL